MMKRHRLFTALLSALLLFTSALISCGKEDTTENETTLAETEEAVSDIVIAKRGEDTQFRLAYNVESEESVRDNILEIKKAYSDKLGVKLMPLDDYDPSNECDFEIIVGSTKREECVTLTNSLEDGEYAIKAVSDNGRQKIVIAYKGNYARIYAIKTFIDNYIGEDYSMVPENLDLKGRCDDWKSVIVSKIPQLRDPCILEENGVYYAYGTGWVYYKNTSGYLDGDWSGPYDACEVPADCAGDKWAPEVHKYNGAYYMLTTYRSAKTGHRGCTVMKSDTPEGPFKEISSGHVTPLDWDSIDGTLYIDKDGQPWMVFVHEWTSTDDKVGRFAAAKFSDDLTSLVSEPIELFRADAPSWSTNNVTDGCWMYTTKDGELLMLWSNWDKYGYCVGIARSKSGDIAGPWTQDEDMLYSRVMKNVTNDYDGGHSMIFKTPSGQMYLALHSPNSSSAGRPETPIFVPIKEENGTLVWDIFDTNN